MQNALDLLYERGFIKQTVYEDDLRALLGKQSVSFYVGFDPTADSLHIGHYIPIMAMAHMQRCGHKPVALVGGATAMIGDPSGKTDMRNMLTTEEINQNVAAIKTQLSRFLNFEGEGGGDNGAVIVNNADWLCNLNYIGFLREVGAHFSVNKMLTAECFKARMEKGLSFLEFNYMLMQAYDFLTLFRSHKCVLEMGGNDQWSNILAGADLIRRKEGKDAYAATFTLLETSSGEKMGKTQKGALWLSADKTTPYEFYQYFRNVEDVKVAECLKLLTFLPLDQIEELTKYKDERINAAKSVLAYEVTKLVHGEEAAEKAKVESQGAFGAGAVMPTLQLALIAETQIADIIFMSGLCGSKSEGRRLIEGGGIKINETKVEHPSAVLGAVASEGEFILHKGKKSHLKIVIS